MDPDPVMNELLELAFGEAADESAEDEGDDFISRALDGLSGLTVAEPKDEMESALDALASVMEQGAELFSVEAQVEQVVAVAPQPAPAPKPVLTIAEQKHELLVQLLALKKRHGGLERVPRNELDDLREVTERWQEDELDAWRKAMGTYVLSQALKPAEKRDVSGVNQYFDALTVFIDQAFSRTPRRVKNTMMARCSYIMLGALHMAHRAPRLGRGGEYNVANMIRIWSSCDQWLKQGNTLQKPEAQSLLERCRDYVTDFVRDIRNGWESEKARIGVDDVRNLVSKDPLEVEIFSAQSADAESHLIAGEKILASALSRSAVDDQTISLLERVLVMYHAYKRAKAEETAESEVPLSTANAHQQALGFLQMAKEKYEEVQHIQEHLLQFDIKLKLRVFDPEEDRPQTIQKLMSNEEATHSRKFLSLKQKGENFFWEAGVLEWKAGEIFASLEHGEESNPFLDALAEDPDLAFPETDDAEDNFDALLEQTLL